MTQCKRCTERKTTLCPAGLAILRMARGGWTSEMIERALIRGGHTRFIPSLGVPIPQSDIDVAGQNEQVELPLDIYHKLRRVYEHGI
jgi:hypothetical protein